MVLGPTSPAVARPRRRGFVLFVSLLLIGFGYSVIAAGETLVTTTRAWITSYQLRGVAMAVRTYVDRYGALPGDDANASRRFGRSEARQWGTDGFQTLVGNGRIDGTFFDRMNPEGEQYAAWRDLRFSNLWSGDPELTGMAALPDNLFGGVMGFSEQNLGMQDVLCLTGLPGDAAGRLDTNLDDGAISTGHLRGRIRETTQGIRSVYPVPGEGAYLPGKVYMVCVRLESLS